MYSAHRDPQNDTCIFDHLLVTVETLTNKMFKKIHVTFYLFNFNFMGLVNVGQKTYLVIPFGPKI